MLDAAYRLRHTAFDYIAIFFAAAHGFFFRCYLMLTIFMR